MTTFHSEGEVTHVTQKVAENVWLQAVARLSMALALPATSVICWLGWQYLDTKFTAQDQKISTYQMSADNQSKITTARVETVEKTAQTAIDQASKVNDRLISVETKQTQDSVASDKFQTATISRLDRVQDSIVGLSNAVSALTATLQAIEQNRQTELKKLQP